MSSIDKKALKLGRFRPEDMKFYDLFSYFEKEKIIFSGQYSGDKKSTVALVLLREFNFIQACRNSFNQAWKNKDKLSQEEIDKLSDTKKSLIENILVFKTKMLAIKKTVSVQDMEFLLNEYISSPLPDYITVYAHKQNVNDFIEKFKGVS